MYCSKCGKEISYDSKFCNFCGTKVEIIQKQSATKSVVEKIIESAPSTITVNHDLSIFISYLRYKGKKYLFSDIKSLSFSRFVSTMNFTPYINQTSFSIIFDNDERIYIDIDKWITRGEKSKLLEKCFYFLQENTFQIRSNKIINALNKDGYIKFGCPEVCLYVDGTIEDEKSHRLKISKSTKSLRIGFGKGNYRYQDPDEIRISDKPRPFLDIDVFESKNTIKFHLYENKDIIRALFEYFINQ